MGAYAKWKYDNYIFKSKMQYDALIVIYYELPKNNGVITEPEKYGSNHISHTLWDDEDEISVAEEIIKRFPFGKEMVDFMLKNNICFTDKYFKQINKRTL